MPAKIIDLDLVTDEVLERFWYKVDDSNPYDCWNWQAGVNSHGYGLFRFKGRKVQAHRFSWVVSQTKPPDQDPKMHICHSCDNPLCCNPTHLRQDTQSSNEKDKRKNGNAGRNQKLTIENVAEIRLMLAEGKYNQTEIGSKFGVSRHSVSDIKTGRRWKD